MPTKTGKPTREEKSEINKKNWQENILKARALTKLEKEAAIKTIKEDDSVEWQDKFVEAIKLGLNMIEAAKASTKGLDSVYRLLDDDEKFKKDYTHARLIADENKASFLEEMQNEEPRTIYDPQGNAIYDKTDLMWRKAKEDTTKWLLAIRDPAKYGTNSKIDANISGAITTRVIRDDIK